MLDLLRLWEQTMVMSSRGCFRVSIAVLSVAVWGERTKHWIKNSLNPLFSHFNPQLTPSHSPSLFQSDSTIPKHCWQAILNGKYLTRFLIVIINLHDLNYSWTVTLVIWIGMNEWIEETKRRECVEERKSGINEWTINKSR